MATQVVNKLSQHDIDLFRKISEDKYIWDKQVAIYEAKQAARAEGRNEGLAEGEARGEAKSRRQILELLSQGISVEELQRQLTMSN